MLTLEEGETGGRSRAGLEEPDEDVYIIKNMSLMQQINGKKIIKSTSEIQTVKPSHIKRNPFIKKVQFMPEYPW